MKKASILMGVLLWLPLGIGSMTMQSGYDLFQRALLLERADGKLQEAIALYQRIIKESQDESLAAKAQLQIGMCYRKLGHSEAQNAFQKVIDNYARQAETVRLAREQLSLLVKAQAVAEGKDSELRIRQVWAGPGTDNYGAPSPDGRYLSYVDWGDGNLAVLDLATGAHRRLTNKGPWDKSREFAEHSVWSPDSKLLAYSWYTDPDDRAEVRIIGIDGSNTRVLCSEEGRWDTPVSWSPDGKRIAIFRRGDKKGDLIAQAEAADSSIRVLKALAPSDDYWVRLSFSPDSRYLAYDFPVANNTGKFDISLLAADGSGEIPVVTHPANDSLLGWIKDTSEILFSSDRFGTEDAWALRVAGGKPQDPPELIRRSVGEIRPMGFTPEGTFFFGVSTRQFTIQIASYDPEKPGLQIRTEKTLLGSNILGDWSPDGEHMLYVTEEREFQGVAKGVHIRNLRTGEERILARDLKVRLPSWSVDGRSIVVGGIEANRKEADYKGGIYRIDTDTGHVTKLTLFSDSIPAWWGKGVLWSRVGESMIYADRGCLWTRELKSGQEKELYCHSSIARYARFSAISPDGKNLAFGTMDEKKNTVTIWTMPVEGGKPSELLTAPGSKNIFRTIGGVDWTPDGKYLVYAKDEGNGYGVYQIPATGGDPQKIYHSKDLYFLHLSVHPDGKQIALCTGVPGDEVWVMENLRRPK